MFQYQYKICQRLFVCINILLFKCHINNCWYFYLFHQYLTTLHNINNTIQFVKNANSYSISDCKNTQSKLPLLHFYSFLYGLKKLKTHKSVMKKYISIKFTIREHVYVLIVWMGNKFHIDIIISFKITTIILYVQRIPWKLLELYRHDYTLVYYLKADLKL